MTNQKNRHAYLNIKDKGVHSLRTIDTECYPVSEEELEAQAQQIMVFYCKSGSQIKKEREQLEKQLQVLGEIPDLSAETIRE